MKKLIVVLGSMSVALVLNAQHDASKSVKSDSTSKVVKADTAKAKSDATKKGAPKK